jgi:hypothetical protein
MRVYQHSGAVPPTGAIMALAAGSLASAVFGIAYSFSFYYIPYVYLNFILAAAFGGGTGWVVGVCAKEGKIRNVAAVGTLALIAVLAGIYAEWGSTVYAMFPAAEISRLWAKVGISTFHPLAIVRLMQGLFAEGSWGMTANNNVTGWPLVGLWVFEAGLVICTCIATAVAQIAEHPFCEACQRWVSGHTPHFYAGDGSESVWTDVQHGTFEPLALTPRAEGSEPTYVRLTLKSCDGCSDSNFVTITACQNTVDSKGNPKHVETNLVSNLILQPTQVEIIEAANILAPAPGETATPMPGATGSWTMQSTPQPDDAAVLLAK